MADESLHLVMTGLSFVGAFLGGLVRGSKLDPRIRARLRWLTGSVKAVAKKAGQKLEPEPLEWHSEETDPGRRT